MTKISVIIPYFKKRFFLRNTLLSFLKQTHKNFKIIVIYDDISKDDLEYVKKLTKIDKRIKLIVNKKNIGAGLSRNKGILKATGKFVCFIDADDIWRENKLKYQLKLMEKKN